VVTAAPAGALGGGFDPEAGPVVIPGTSTVVSEWKLAGQGFAQGVQVAPQWIIASGHAHPTVGATFRNEYGAAMVDKLAGVCGVQASGCDISVAHLATPIQAPSFAPLLLDGVPAQPGTTVAGDTLAVGNGGSKNGRPTVGWTQPTPNGMTFPLLQSGLGDIDGDSGGPSFYYYPGATTGVLQGLNSTQSFGVAAGLQQFNSAKVKPFLDAMLPAGAINWVTLGQLGPAALVPEPVASPAVTLNAASLTMTWPAVTATPPVTGYRAVAVRADNILSATVVPTSAAARTATFTGLTPGVAYGVFVLASNANGDSRAPFASLSGTPGAPPTPTWPTIVAITPPPVTPGLTVTSSHSDQLSLSIAGADTPIPGVTSWEAIVGQCTASPCSPATTTQIADETLTQPASLIALPAATPPGAQFEVQVRERNTAGVSAAASQLVTYIPQDTPLPPASLTVTPQADGATKVSFVPSAADPQPGFAAGYLPHSPAGSYVIEVDIPGQGTELVDTLDPGQTTDSFNIADFGVGPGDYSVSVLAISGWGVSPPLAVTAPLGVLPAPAPVTATRTPAVPPAPANLDVPLATVAGTNTVTWTEPVSVPGVAAPDGYLIAIQDQGSPAAPPVVAEVPANQLSYPFQAPSDNKYTVNVYAFSQQAGASAPAALASSLPGYETASQSSDGTLWASGYHPSHNISAILATGTAPSVASLGSGGFEVAFQGANFDLWTMSPAGTLQDLGMSMRPGTSPGITPVPGGHYEIAYQATDGTLHTTGFLGTTGWGVAVSGKTSPSITALGGATGGYEVAFNDANGDLWTASSSAPGQSQDLGLAMAAGSSPGIAAIERGGDAEIAYQGADHTLYTTGHFGTTRWGLGLNAKSSPSITAVAAGGSDGGYEVAVEGANNDVWTAFSGGFSQSQDLSRLTMAADTSPAISALPSGGAVIAYHATSGAQWNAAVDPVGNAVDAIANTGVPMASAASPAIGAF
jgi:hypothetical protein